ncbi:hypothetical protein [Pseudomonas amygdali]|nr:hypothetical protein PLA107_030630 [Pseudomonas amygdali pv. lachrymans str. M301315]
MTTPRFDLYRHSANPSPEQLFDVCREFSAFLAKSKDEIWSRNFNAIIYFAGENEPSEPKAESAPIQPEDLLISAEQLAEQIIGHYGGLSAVSRELADFDNSGLRLPTEALDVFLYACAREHESLGTMLNEMDILYGDGVDSRSYRMVQDFLRDTTLVDIPRPTLWSHDGRLKYSPIAFYHIYHKEMVTEVGYLCSTGSDGVQKILSTYQEIDERSRDHLDLMMRNWAHQSGMALNDNRRKLLAHVLHVVKEGRVVIRMLFEKIGDSSDERLFMARLKHATEIIRSLPPEKADGVLEGVTQCIKMWTEEPDEDLDIFSEPEIVIPRLVMILNQIREFGYCALEAVAMHACLGVSDLTDKKRVERIIDRGFSEGSDHLSTHAAWREAVLLAADEGFLLTLGLGERHLAALYKLKGTPMLRDALLETGRGRDLILGHDLGL